MKNISLLIMFALFISACSDNQKLRVVSDIEQGVISINNEVKGEIRVGYATIMIPSGDHFVEVKKKSKDGEWIYLAKKNITVNKDKTTVIELDTQKIESQYRKDRLAKLEKSRLEKEARDKMSR